jgi:hypothetical protein
MPDDAVSVFSSGCGKPSSQHRCMHALCFSAPARTAWCPRRSPQHSHVGVTDEWLSNHTLSAFACRSHAGLSAHTSLRISAQLQHQAMLMLYGASGSADIDLHAVAGRAQPSGLTDTALLFASHAAHAQHAVAQTLAAYVYPPPPMPNAPSTTWRRRRSSAPASSSRLRRRSSASTSYSGRDCGHRRSRSGPRVEERRRAHRRLGLQRSAGSRGRAKSGRP